MNDSKVRDGSQGRSGVDLATILAGATTVHAQQDRPPNKLQRSSLRPQPPASNPAQPPGHVQQSGSVGRGHRDPGGRLKVKDYKNWTFNVGGGASLTSGTTTKFVRSGGGIAAAGVARNYSKYFGLRLDFQLDNLPLRTSALQLAQAPGATSHVYSFTLDPIINIPVTKTWGGYFVVGPRYFHRSGKLDSSTAIPGIGLQRVLALVGNMLQRQSSLESEISFRQREPIWLELRRRHHAPDHPTCRALRRVPLPARLRQQRHDGLAPDYGRPALVGINCRF